MNLFVILLSVFLFAQQAAAQPPGGLIDTSGLDALLPDTQTSGANQTSANQTSPSEPAETKATETKAAETKLTTNKPAKSSGSGLSFTVLVQGGGIIGYVIILLSFAAVALIIEHCLSIRRKNFALRIFADEVLQLIQQGHFAPALKKCKEDPSVLAQTLAGAMPEFEFGWEAVEKKAEETMAEYAKRYYRKIEYLNLIGNLAQMLGLLGTVVGMVIAFNQLAESEGYASAADLAGGIYIALVTTVQGLVVAIPALAAYSYFGSRIASLMSETAVAAEQILMPVKKGLLKKTK
jgi:biopolymer transport protein ExbB